MQSLLRFRIIMTYWVAKNWQFLCAYKRRQLTDVPTFFAVRIRRKFVLVQSLNIPLHLKYVATLPCEMKCATPLCIYTVLDEQRNRSSVSRVVHVNEIYGENFTTS